MVASAQTAYITDVVAYTIWSIRKIFKAAFNSKSAH